MGPAAPSPDRTDDRTDAAAACRAGLPGAAVRQRKCSARGATAGGFAFCCLWLHRPELWPPLPVGWEPCGSQAAPQDPGWGRGSPSAIWALGRGGQHWTGWSRLWSLEGAPSPGDSRCPLVACSPGACEQPMGVWASPWAWGVPRVGFFLFGGIQAAHGTGTPDLGCLAHGRGRGRSPAFSVLCSWGAGSVPLGLRAPGWLWARPPARAAPHGPAVPAPPGPGHPSACSTEPAGLRAVCRAIDL